MARRVLAIFLLLLSLCLFVATPILAFTSSGNQFLYSSGLLGPTPTPTLVPFPYKPTPIPTPKVPIVVHAPLPPISARAFYLVDMDTGTVLANNNGTTPLPMASTTKMMTALIAIQAGNPNQIVTVKQDALDEVAHDGSNAGLHVGETFQLKDMLYWLMVPSGDDAAVAIADALGGTQEKFVQRMNLFAYRLRLFQTHFADPDGLNWRNSPDHYSSAADLTHLAIYAMQIPQFAQLVKTQSYAVTANGQHLTHKCINTNSLLAAYPGILGIKTGHTDAAGWCLVFAAEHNGHRLIGTVLGSPTEYQRNNDATSLLNWGFSLPMKATTAKTGVAFYCQGG